VNDRARDALVRAAMAGTPQILGRLANVNGGRCAIGVLMEEVGADFSRGSQLPDGSLILSPAVWFQAEHALRYELGVDPAERTEIVHRNNAGESFLGIARKKRSPETTLQPAGSRSISFIDETTC